MLNWGIVSCGEIVNIRVAPAINENPECTLVGFYSTSLARAKDVAGRFATPDHPPFATDDLESLLMRDDVHGR